MYQGPYRTALLFAAAIVIVVAGALLLRHDTLPKYALARVTRGPIIQEVLASGNVESPSATELHFKSSGTLTVLAVRVGDRVREGEILAKQDTSVLEAQLQKANAAVTAAQAVLQKLRAGATPETIAVSQSQLGVARQVLDNAYASVPNALSDAYAKANDAVTNQLALFFTNSQTANPRLTFVASDGMLENRIVAERVDAGNALAALFAAHASFAAGNTTAALEAALASAETQLGTIKTLLNDAVAAVAVSSGLSSTEASSYRIAAATGLTETNAAISAIQALRQSIESNKAAVAAAQASLDLTNAGSASEDVAAQQAAVEEASANAASIAAQIRDLEIIAPFGGIVTDTNGTRGEVVTPSTAVISLMPDAALDVRVNISEDNIVGVKVGDGARIELDAFPAGARFAGAVSAIDPAETVIGGAIYYQATLLFKDVPEGIRSGMTANVWIETASSTDALVVPASALSGNGSERSVEVFTSGALETRSVTTGLRSADGMVEVTAGLSEGEQVVTGTMP